MHVNENLNKYSLITKPAWTYQDIMEWCGVSKATAIRIKKRAIKEQNGKVAYGDNYAKTDSVLALYGTNREREIELLKKIINL